MTTQFDIVGIGGCSIDTLLTVEHFPLPDSKLKVNSISKQGGGNTANALVCTARLGLKTTYVGKLGDDEPSSSLLHDFSTEGVDIEGVIVEPGAGPYIAYIIVDKSSTLRTILWTDDSVRALNISELPESLITRSKILYFDDCDFCPLQTAKAALKLAKGHGLITVFDAENARKTGYCSLLKYVDYLIISTNYAQELCHCTNVESAAQKLLEFGTRTVVITHGASGAYLFTPSMSLHQPAFSVPVVDTTGCGDAFHGGFMYGLIKHWAFEKTLLFASAVAAIKCTRLGARTGCPTMREVTEFLIQQNTPFEWGSL